MMNVNRSWLAGIVTGILLFSGPWAEGAEAQFVELRVHPARIELHDMRRSSQLVATARTPSGQWKDVTPSVQLRIDGDPIAAALDGGRLRPTEAGEATVVVQLGPLEQNVPLRVLDDFRTRPVSFQHDVLPALSKQSCSSGACHGSPNGKGGFRLSLRGFDPALDEQTLIREEYGRRTNPFEPELSLLLRKPTMKVPHGGGLQLKTDTAAFHLLTDWISQGCPVQTAASQAECLRIQVFPASRVLYGAGEQQQLAVDAFFSDGTVRDVTELAVFETSHGDTASVNASGQVRGIRRGEATILAKYLDHVSTAGFTVLEDVPGFAEAWDPPDTQNFIDELVFTKLEKLRVPVSPLCSDETFVRRASLDVTGLLPSPADVEAFTKDPNPEKRSELIDRLLERPEYARYWAQKWGDLLRVKSSKVSAAGVHKFHRWLVAALERNEPYDTFARDLLTSSGSTFLNPPANYYRTASDVNDCAETTAQLFLGIRIGCARCHNHPFESWSQDQYYGLGSFFTGVGRKESSIRGDLIIYSQDAEDALQPRTGERVEPWLPSTGHLAVGSGTDRRSLLAKHLTSSESRLFAQVGVNRLWGHLFGRGVVEPVDDFRVSNPPAHAELLERLTDEFVASGFDQKRMLRLILNSATYQLSSRTLPLNADDERYFSHYYSRLLGPERLLDAVGQVTGVKERFAGLPGSVLATQLPSPDVGSPFLKVFGQPGRNTACACERDVQPKLTHALQLISGEFLLQKLADPSSRLSRALDDTGRRVEAAGEPPTAQLALWLRADQGVEGVRGDPIVNGGSVATWNDLRESSEKGDLSARQEKNASQPTFVANGIGGLPALRFDGRDDFLSNESCQLVPPGGPRTVFIVARREPGRDGGALFTFQRSTNRAAGSHQAVFAVQHVEVSDAYYVYSDGVHGAGNARLPSSLEEVLGSEAFITCFQSGGEGAKLAVAVNGNPLPVSQAGTIGNDAGPGGFTVGSREDIPVAAQIWDGSIAEVLVYDAELEEPALTEIGSYLATRYGLKTNYPAKALNQPSPEAQANDDALLDQLYRTAFARQPTDNERAAAHDYLAGGGSRRAAWEDLFWAVLNSKEFLFQH